MMKLKWKVYMSSDKCEFHRWTMLIEKQLQHILEPLDFTLGIL